MKFERHFSWQVQYLVKFGKIAGVPAKCCIFEHKMFAPSETTNLGCAARCRLTGSVLDHGRVVLGSWSSIANYVSALFSKFLSDFGWSLFVAGAEFGDIGRWLLLLHARTFDISYGRMINHESHFLWQGQYLVTLKDGFCCSAQGHLTLYLER